MGAVDSTSVGGPAPRYLSREEQLRLQSHLREHERILKQWKKMSLSLDSLISEDERDASNIRHARYALHHYNAKHPCEGFDVVKPLMGATVRFKGQSWYHVNFWARCRKSKKIKRFFAEVHYKLSGSSSACSGLPFPVPGDEKPPSSSSVCSYLPFPVPEAEKPSSSSSVSLNLPCPAPVPIVEACTILEEPLGRYRKSCAFCRGHMDILHPKGRKFVCGNDKDRVVQQLSPGKSLSGEMLAIHLPHGASLSQQSRGARRLDGILNRSLGHSTSRKWEF